MSLPFRVFLSLERTTNLQYGRPTQDAQITSWAPWIAQERSL